MGFVRRFALYSAALAALSLAGCGRFFPPPGTTTGDACTDCFYVTLGSNNGLAGYGISSAGALTQAGSTIALTGVGTSLAVSPVAPYLYVGSLEGGFVLAYTINSDGSLTAATAANGTSIVTGLSPTAITVDPTGNYLIVVSQGALCQNNSTQTCFVLSSVPISSSTGAASGTVTSFSFPVNGVNLGNSCSTVAACNQVSFSPNGSTAYIALGNGGLYSFSFSGGALGETPLATLIPASNVTSVNSVAANTTLIFAGASGTAGGLYGFTVTSGGGSALAHSPFTTGDSGTHSEWAVALSGSQYVYVTNAAAGTITGYAQSSLTGATDSTPTALSGSPYTASTATGNAYNTTGLVIDSSGKFVIATSAAGSYDVSLFTIGTDGSLGTATTQIDLDGSSSGEPLAIAATASGT